DNLTFPSADLVLPVKLQAVETAKEVTVELPSDVLFDFDKADIRPDAADALTEVAAIIKEKARGAVRVEGHTDGKGGDAYNQKRADRRGAAGAGWLPTRGGLRTTKFMTVGFGARQPVAPNAKPDGSDDPEGRQKNRRVSIVITK